MSSSTKHIFVTGASSGIGLALCKRLATEYKCKVYLGSRNVQKGATALKSIVDKFPETKDLIEVVQIDVGDEASIAGAAKVMETKGVPLYALVNNAGVGSFTGEVAPSTLIDINYIGARKVTDAFVSLVEKGGRIVNTSSGAASMFLREQDEATKTLFSNPPSMEALDKEIEARLASGDTGMANGYGLSKAALTAMTILHAKLYPNLSVVSLSPGFIDTPMTKGFGASLTPEQGCKSLLKCLFEPVTSGWYYGSDGLRSPLTCTRDPDTPEYEGEENPDPAKYNK